MKRPTVFLGSILLIAACASRQESLLHHNLNAEKGSLTFRRTVHEWGSPVRVTVTDIDTVFSATWPANDRRRRLPASGLPDERGQEITLAFEKATGVLVDWSYGNR